MTLRRARAVVLVALVGLVPGAGRAQDDVPPEWRLAYDYLVQDVCLGASGDILIGVSPAEGAARCPRHRDLAIGERLPYHKHDWANANERDRLPGGYQRSDDFPIRTRRLGIAVVQTFDFGAPPDRFDRFDRSDGGQVALLSPRSAAYGVTEDGGGGLQFFYGQACDASDPGERLRDSWVIVDRSFPSAPAGQMLARLTQSPERCPSRLSNADTHWRLQHVTLRVRLAGGPIHRDFEALISDHFGGRTPELANHLERFYFTRELGLVRWERWENLARPGDAAARGDAPRRADELARSDRCESIAAPPAPTGQWLMTDCRQWTVIVPPSDPSGDPPRFWIDRLRTLPATADLFAE